MSIILKLLKLMNGEFSQYKFKLSNSPYIRSGLLLLMVIMFLSSCQTSYAPKPRGYFRIDFPDHTYQPYNSGSKFFFEFPDYAIVRPYSGAFSDDPDAENWINIDFPKFSAHIHLTYKTVRNNLGQLIEDAHTFAFKHSIKADAINQFRFEYPDHHFYGVKYEIKGNTASRLQFFGTDSTTNFLRGALYFDSEPNKDSLAPVISFLEKDVDYLIKTLEWKDAKTN